MSLREELLKINPGQLKDAMKSVINRGLDDSLEASTELDRIPRNYGIANSVSDGVREALESTPELSESISYFIAGAELLFSALVIIAEVEELPIID